ncbi:hypothetical protein ACQEV4_31305 [Streptomyces shenzhenensis]|uniref:hypothetical protein n=1 Tax=Streptomyces shenzhenensis TaxID=943815 RepID=UPI003D8D319D
MSDAGARSHDVWLLESTGVDNSTFIHQWNGFHDPRLKTIFNGVVRRDLRFIPRAEFSQRPLVMVVSGLEGILVLDFLPGYPLGSTQRHGGSLTKGGEID